MALLVQGADRLPVAAVGTLEPLQRGDEQGIRGRETEVQVEDGARVGIVQAPGPVTSIRIGGVEGRPTVQPGAWATCRLLPLANCPHSRGPKWPAAGSRSAIQVAPIEHVEAAPVGVQQACPGRVAVQGLQQQAALGRREPPEQTVLEAIWNTRRVRAGPSTSGSGGQLAAGVAGAMRVKA